MLYVITSIRKLTAMQKIILFLLLAPLLASTQKLSTIDEKTKDLKKFEGFFNFYWDESTGKIWLEVDTLDTEILFYSFFTSRIRLK